METRSEQLRPLIKAGLTLIPLHGHGDRCAKGRPLGKAPRDARWQSRDYSGFDAFAHMETGDNVGVRLGGLIVADWDPRNHAEGDARLEDAIADGLVIADAVVETGSGGAHCYMRLPMGVEAADLLETLPRLGKALEFKSGARRQVVAPGSVHPDTGRAYLTDPLADAFDAVPEAPAELIDALRRPPAAQAGADGGATHSPDDAAAILARLDASDWRGGGPGGDWFNLMCALHHMTAGAARDEFVAWCAGDPEYAEAGAEVGYRWDSLSREGAGGRPVTAGTLQKLLAERGLGGAWAPGSLALDDDFDDADADEACRGATERPTRAIRVGDGRLVDMVEQAKAALFDAYPDEILQRHGQLVRPTRLQTRTSEDGVRHDAGATVLIDVNESWLRKRMAESATWYRKTAQKGGAPKDKAADPPLSVARTVIADQGDWPFHNLVSVVASPTLDVATGKVVDRPGIDPETGLLAVFDPAAFPRVEPGIGRDEAERRLRRVEHSLFRGMPFVDGPSRAVAMSALVCGVVRATMATCPMHLFDAAAAGTGKSLMADVVGIVAAGVRPSAATWTPSDEENEKRLAAMLRSGPPVALFDNLDATRGDRLGGNQLNVMLTQDPARIRILGRTEELIVNTRVLMLATGNNMEVHADACRRVVKCRLDARCPDPERRQFDWDPKRVAESERGRIVADLLSALSAYYDAGRPDEPPHIGSFEAYTPVRGLLLWCGYDDPAETIDDVKATDHARSESLTALETWNMAFDGEWTTAESVQEFLTDDMADMEIAAGRELHDGREAIVSSLTGGKTNRVWIGRELVKVGGLAAADFYLEVDSRARLNRFRVLRDGK